MLDLEEIKELDDKSLIDLYQLVMNHIQFLNSSYIDLTTDEEEGGEESE